MRFNKAWSSIILIPLLSGCLGSSSSDDSEDASSIEAPTSLSIETEGKQATVDWNVVSDAESYQIYYAEEPSIDTVNYAAFDGGTLVQNVTPPHELELPRLEPVYHFVVTAKANGRESPSTEELKVIPRYQEAGSQGNQVRDLATGLIWARCYIGQSWNPSEGACEGDPKRLNIDQAKSAVSDIGMRLPLEDELLSLRYCNGEDFAFFPEIPSGTDSVSCPPESESPILEPGAFPDPSTEAAVATGSSCAHHDTWNTVAFGDNGTSLCAGPADQLSLYVRPVER